MKTWGIILIVLGSLNVLRDILAAANGENINGAGLAFIVLGAYLLHRGKQKEQEKSDHDKWSQS
ncbi:MAG: hypothetical protein IKN11_10395 [Bacteroidales bacterium]|nr:hypothetical protein [Bacteroidales bacterium]